MTVKRRPSRPPPPPASATAMPVSAAMPIAAPASAPSAPVVLPTVAAPRVAEIAGSEKLVHDLRARLVAGYPILCVVTHEEARACELVTHAAAGVPVHTWRLGDADSPAAALDAMVKSAEPGVHVFLDLHTHLGDPAVVRGLRNFASKDRGDGEACVLVMPVERVPLELERDVTTLALPLPSENELGEVLDGAVGAQLHPTVRTRLLRGALGLTRDEADRAFRLAITTAKGDAHSAIRTVTTEKQRALRRSAALELIDTDIAVDSVGGLDMLKTWLKSRVLAFGPEARAFGLREPRGMFVCGVAGCGKSLVSKAAARVLGIPLVRLDFAELFSVASPEHAMLEAMRTAEAVAPVVLWVDEIEKGLGQVNGDGSQARVFGAFLTWLQERTAPIFVAATANEVERLPPEVTRRGRFDEVFFVDLPSPKEREEILRVHLTARGRDPSSLGAAELAKMLEHFSGAELEQLVQSALFRAFSQKREITEGDMRVAAKEIVPLATLHEEKVQALRTWAQARARRASADRRTLDLFGAD